MTCSAAGPATRGSAPARPRGGPAGTAGAALGGASLPASHGRAGVLPCERPPRPRFAAPRVSGPPPAAAGVLLGMRRNSDSVKPFESRETRTPPSPSVWHDEIPERQQASLSQDLGAFAAKARPLNGSEGSARCRSLPGPVWDRVLRGAAGEGRQRADGAGGGAIARH